MNDKMQGVDLVLNALQGGVVTKARIDLGAQRDRIGAGEGSVSDGIGAAVAWLRENMGETHPASVKAARFAEKYSPGSVKPTPAPTAPPPAPTPTDPTPEAPEAESEPSEPSEDDTEAD